MSLFYYQIVFAVFAFIMGTIVGSFLNVCIHRMPRDLSVNKPKRSFCPSCGKQIPLYRNIPVFSWILLRGRCADCGVSISPRYLLVEVLTGISFLALWLSFPPLLAMAYWIMISLFIVATFIDIEHFIIPDEITWGGTAAGVVCSLLVPELMNESSHWKALLWSFTGAAAGYFTLWGVVEAGKMAFGKKKIDLGGVQPFTWKRNEDTATLLIGEESMEWSEIFSRESDLLTVEMEGEVDIDGEKVNEKSLRMHYNRMDAGGKEWLLDHIESIRGRVVSIIIPREAMGFGDVKFIASVGAFLGWKAVFFTIFAASVIGSVVGMTAILLSKREWSAKIPFGPYLALGAVIWLFFGESVIAWYASLLMR